MSPMPDPINILVSLQQALDSGMPTNLHEHYEMFYDEPFVGGRRYSFAKIINNEVQSISIFGLEEPIDGIICYNVGYAVKEKFRGKGLAIEAVLKGIDSLRNEFRPIGVKKFYVEAVIDVTNKHSIYVAEALFLNQGESIYERETKAAALHFKKLVIV